MMMPWALVFHILRIHDILPNFSDMLDSPRDWNSLCFLMAIQGMLVPEFLKRVVVDGARLPVSFDDQVCPMALRKIMSSCWLVKIF